MQAVLRQDGKFPVKKELFTILEIIGAKISPNLKKESYREGIYIGFGVI